MKSLKLILINALTLIVGLALMSGTFTQKSANAARLETIPAMQINRLGNFRGQFLTVLYAVGSRPLISTDSSQINISQVKESKTIYITDDSLTVPAVQVTKEGFRPSYNIVVFVVSRQSNYSWLNADGTLPQGMTETTNHTNSLVNGVNKSEIDGFISKNGDNALLQINLVN